MEKNNKIDELFYKGIEGFSVTPSSEIKKKIFASPSAITPIKPWYIGTKGLLFASSIIAVSVILIYFGFYYNNETEKSYTLNNNTKNNILLTENSNTLIKTKNINETEQSTKYKVQSIKYKVENNELVANSNNKTSNYTNKKNQELDNVNLNKKLENQINRHAELTHYAELISASNSPSANNTNNKLPNSLISKNTVESQQLTNNKSLAELNSVVPANREKPVVEKNHNSESEHIAKYNSHAELVSASPNVKGMAGQARYDDNAELERHAELVSASSLIFMNKLLPILSSQQLTKYMNLVSEKPAHYKKGLWYIEANSGMFVTNYKVTTGNNELKLAKNAKQEMLKPSIGREMGINAVYQQKRFIYKAGLSYVNYGEKLSGKMFLNNPYNTTSINYNGGYYETIINGNYYDIDSTSYFHYTYTQTDHIYATDSTQAWNTHNRPVDVLDTVNITKYDTVPKTVLYNNISYLQIPLSVGYTFPFGRFGFTVLATVTPGYFVKVNGSQMNVASYPAIEPYSKNTIKKFMLSAGIGLEINYYLNETLIISIEPFYRKSILGMYNQEYKLNQNSNNYGVRLSVRKLF